MPSLILLILMRVQTLVKIQLFVLKIFSGNEILTSFKGHNSLLNQRKLMLNDNKLDVVNTNAYATFCQNQLLHSQDIQRKRNIYVNQGP